MTRCIWCNREAQINDFGECFACNQAALKAVEVACDFWDWAIRGGLIIAGGLVVGLLIWMVWP